MVSRLISRSCVTGLFCHRHLRITVLSKPGRADSTSANLTPASGRQDHTTSPYAATSLVRVLLTAHGFKEPALRSHRTQNAAASTASRAYVRDDRETPLCVGRDAKSSRGDLGGTKTEIFLQRGLDTFSTKLPDGQITPSSSSIAHLRYALSSGAELTVVERQHRLSQRRVPQRATSPRQARRCTDGVAIRRRARQRRPFGVWNFHNSEFILVGWPMSGMNNCGARIAARRVWPACLRAKATKRPSFSPCQMALRSFKPNMAPTSSARPATSRWTPSERSTYGPHFLAARPGTNFERVSNIDQMSASGHVKLVYIAGPAYGFSR
jgi:hypothetical protein